MIKIICIFLKIIYLFFRNFCDCCTGKKHENLFCFLLSGIWVLFISLHIENSFPVLTFASSRSAVPYLSEFCAKAEYCKAWAPRWTDEREGGGLAFKGSVYIFISNYCLFGCFFFLLRFCKHWFLPKTESETKWHRHIIEKAKPLKSKCAGLPAAHSSQQEGYSFMGTRAVTCGQKKWPVVLPAQCGVSSKGQTRCFCERSNERRQKEDPTVNSYRAASIQGKFPPQKPAAGICSVLMAKGI